MKFGYTILYVDNVLESVAFYEKAFGLKRGFVHESQSYAELETGATKLAFASKELGKANGLELQQPSSGAAPFEIALVTEDVKAAYAQAVEHGSQGLVPPTEKPWGQVVGYVKDCNGVLVEICSPIG